MNIRLLVSPRKAHVELQQQQLGDPGPGEIQVEVHASVVSPGTERAFILNLENTPGVYPWYPGYSAAGVVMKTGEGVTEFKAGDRVACNKIPHRSHGNTHVRWAVAIPEGVTFEQAAFISLGVIAAQGVRKARIELGEDVLVFGLGMIGQLALQLARAGGAALAAGIDQAENRIRLALDCGADLALDSADPDWPEQLKAATGGLGPHVVIESTGAAEVIGMALQQARPFGRLVLLGSTRGESTINFYRDVHKKGVTIIGAHIYGGNPALESRPGFWTWRDDALAFMKLLHRGRIRVDPLITERVPWQDAEAAYQDILAWNRQVTGTLIRWV